MQQIDQHHYQHYLEELQLKPVQAEPLPSQPLLKPILLEFNEVPTNSFGQSCMHIKSRREVLSNSKLHQLTQQRQLETIESNFKRLSNSPDFCHLEIMKNLNSSISRPKIVQMLSSSPKQKLSTLKEYLRGIRNDNESYLKDRNRTVQQKIKNKFHKYSNEPINHSVSGTKNKNLKYISMMTDGTRTVSKIERYCHDNEVKCIKDDLHSEQSQAVCFSPSSFKMVPGISSVDQNYSVFPSSSNRKERDGTGKYPKMRIVKTKRRCFTILKEQSAVESGKTSPTNIFESTNARTPWKSGTKALKESESESKTTSPLLNQMFASKNLTTKKKSLQNGQLLMKLFKKTTKTHAIELLKNSPSLSPELASENGIRGSIIGRIMQQFEKQRKPLKQEGGQEISQQGMIQQKRLSIKVSPHSERKSSTLCSKVIELNPSKSKKTVISNRNMPVIQQRVSIHSLDFEQETCQLRQKGQKHMPHDFFE